MTLLEQINQDMVQAMRDNKALARDVLRMVKTTIKNSEINKGRELAEEEVVEVLVKELKQRHEAVISFTAGNRPELAEKERQEITVLQHYLPEQMSEAEIAQVVEATIGEIGASGITDMGKVMAAVMAKVKGRADGNLVSQLVRAKLN